MGSEMGEHPDLTQEVTGWVTEVARIPVWAKMTPNITNIKEPATAAVRAARMAFQPLTTILSVIGVNLEHFAPDAHCRGLHGAGGVFIASSKANRFAHGQPTCSGAAKGSFHQWHWWS